MDELLKNYIKHIQVNFSSDLAEELNEILNTGLKMETAIEDIEMSLQNRLIQYFQNLKMNEFEKTSKCIYEAYVDYDDENLIRSVRFLIRIYTKFLNLKLAKFFCNWRIKAMQIANALKFTKLYDYNKNESMNNQSKNDNKEITYGDEEKHREIYLNRNKIDRISKSKNEFVNSSSEDNEYNSINKIKNNNYNNDSKLNYHYNYDPSRHAFENKNDKYKINSQNNQSDENNDKRSIEDKHSKLNLKSESISINIPIDNENGFRNQRNKNSIEKEEESKIWPLKSKIGNNSLADKNDNKSLNSIDDTSPSSKRKASNIDDFNNSKDRINNTKLFNNKEEKRIKIKLEKQKKEKNNSNSLNIFDKLFLESFKKSDEKMLNEEIKKLSELDECTFQPNANKRGFL